MLLACSVDTPIHINRSHLLASRVLCGLDLNYAGVTVLEMGACILSLCIALFLSL